jgi:hypothetical protein
LDIAFPPGCFLNRLCSHKRANRRVTLRRPDGSPRGVVLRRGSAQIAERRLGAWNATKLDDAVGDEALERWDQGTGAADTLCSEAHNAPAPKSRPRPRPVFLECLAVLEVRRASAQERQYDPLLRKLEHRFPRFRHFSVATA